MFTPNGDEKNETFAISASSEVNLYSLQIYQRTGQLIFESDNPNKSWNGDFNDTPLPSGVYFWQAQINCQINKQAIKKNFRGTVSLIR